MTAEGDETHRRLLDRAREHYLEVGAHQFSLREVARRAGVSAAAVYRHFEDKDALLAAICGEGFKAFYGYLMRGLKAPNALEQLRATGKAYLAFALENSEHYRVIFMSPVGVLKEESLRAMFPETMITFQFLVDRVRACQAEEVIREGDPVAVAATIWALVHGLVSLRLSQHMSTVGVSEFEALFTTSTDDLLRGLAP